jgi:hypothetical protein
VSLSFVQNTFSINTHFSELTVTIAVHKSISSPVINAPSPKNPNVSILATSSCSGRIATQFDMVELLVTHRMFEGKQ